MINTIKITQEDINHIHSYILKERVFITNNILIN